MPPGTDDSTSHRVGLPDSNLRRLRLHNGGVRESHFRALMKAEFGAGYARSVACDQVLTALDGRTADEALRAGESPARVWEALCVAMDIPPTRHLGADPDLPPAGSRQVPARTPRDGHRGPGPGRPRDR